MVLLKETLFGLSLEPLDKFDNLDGFVFTPPEPFENRDGFTPEPFESLDVFINMFEPFENRVVLV